MIGNFPLCITIFLDRLFNSLIPLIHIPKNPPNKELLKAGSAQEAFNLGDLRDSFMAFDAIDEPLYKVLCTKDALSLDPLPERPLLYPPSYKPPVFLFCSLPRPAKLLKKLPNNEVLKKLEEWVRTQKTQLKK